MHRLLSAVAVLGALAVLASGCAATEEAGSVPDSARFAPADAVAFASVTTDAGSDQWQQAEAVLDRLPGARDGIAGGIAGQLGEEGLDWETDVAPALGPELVVVGTAQRKPIVVVDPESTDKLDALVAKLDQPVVEGEIDGRVALAETRADLTAYRAALAAGTIEDEPAFVAGMEALPADTLGRVWVDLRAVTQELGAALGQAAQAEKLEVGLDWLAAALTADDDGLLVSLGMRTPGDAGTHYEPELFGGVPADAVAAVSFGGTQGLLDRAEGRVDVDGILGAFEKATGVSVGGLLDSLRGEGVLFVRPGKELPEVTLALAPPDPAKTWSTVDRTIRELAGDAKAKVTTTTENGVPVTRVTAEGVTVTYGRPDSDTVVVTTGADLGVLSASGPKLADSDAFERAAEEVDLEGRTRGFVYVDVDGLVPLVETTAGTTVPPDLDRTLGAVDAVVLQATGDDGDVTQVRGFVRIPD